MTLQEIKAAIASPEYDFLRSNEHLGENICLLTLGGSHAYGTNKEGSDLDIRGCALNTANEILTGQKFEQVISNETDTVVYSFNKLVQLLANANPNTLELLGNKPEFYLHTTPEGRALIENRHLFLSKRAVHTFGGYALSQLRRLENLSARYVSQSEQEKHILDSIENARYDFERSYFPHEAGSVNLYIDKAVSSEMESEIFMDINLKHYPLRDYTGMWNEMKAIASSYNKIGKRNSHAVEHNKISKHMMHLVRLYITCLDILEKEEIVTYREKEHNLLMDIRNGKYVDEHEQPTSDFFDMVGDYEKRLDYAKKNTSLPDSPDMKKIGEFTADINRSVILKDTGANLKKEMQAFLRSCRSKEPSIPCTETANYEEERE